MYHRKQGRKLGRRRDQRIALLRNLAISLVQAERIETTVTRAKEVRRLVERLVTYAKRGGLHGRRLIISKLGNQPAIASKLIDEIAPRYKNRQGGYTRILKTGFRRGDSAPLALIEFIQEDQVPKARKRKAVQSENQTSATPSVSEPSASAAQTPT